MRRLPFFLLLLLLAAGCASIGASRPFYFDRPFAVDHATGKRARRAGRFDASPVALPSKIPAAPNRMRGVWVATVENIDFPRVADRRAFMSAFDRVTADLARANCNALFFQVRPTNDAFYASKLNPWSRWLTGREGGSPGFDPLPAMIQSAHRRGLAFYAWFNPFRVVNDTPLSKAAYLKTLSPLNFARRRPDCVLEIPLGKGHRQLILDPGHPDAVRHVLLTVDEVVRRYPVDGVVFDDYFYPYTAMGNADTATFRKYNPRRLPLAAWRRSNVDAVIAGVRRTVDAAASAQRRRIPFGVSPFGIWANRKTTPAGSLTGGKESLTTQFADTRGWVKKGYLDFIAPQLYWPFSHETAAYAELASWWSAVVRGTRTQLYISQAVYRLGESRTWGAPEIADQLRFNRTQREISGEIFYSYSKMFHPVNAVMKRGVAAMRPLLR